MRGARAVLTAAFALLLVVVTAATAQARWPHADRPVVSVPAATSTSALAGWGHEHHEASAPVVPMVALALVDHDHSGVRVYGQVSQLLGDEWVPVTGARQVIVETRRTGPGWYPVGSPVWSSDTGFVDSGVLSIGPPFVRLRDVATGVEGPIVPVQDSGGPAAVLVHLPDERGGR